jgi:hypothetical protein
MRYAPDVKHTAIPPNMSNSAPEASGVAHATSLPVTCSVNNETTFERARISFLRLVPEPERPLFTEFDDAATLINHIQGIVSQNPALAQPHQWAHKLLKFTKKIECYFDVLNLVFSTNQQCVAVVWGAIRHILRVRVPSMTAFRLRLTFKRCAVTTLHSSKKSLYY